MKKLIKKTFDKMMQRKWNRIYWAVDVHETILEGNYHDDLPKFLPYAKEALQMISDRSDSCLILYSCLHFKDTLRYRALFEENGIFFEYVNANPEVQNTELANFSGKFYFNILIEDKAGFEPERDWIEIMDTLKDYPVLK